MGRNPALLNFRLDSLVAAELSRDSQRQQPGISWNWPDPFSREAIPDDSIVIILMDNYVASAGEFFVSILRRLENALFVGTNTFGVYLTAGMDVITLPRSGLEMRIGTVLTLRPDLSQFEGVGFLPDLWVPPGESLERVLAFIERYGLNR